MRLLASKAGRVVAPIVLTLLLGGSAYAFMATNNVDQSSAGTGNGVTGATVAQVFARIRDEAGLAWPMAGRQPVPYDVSYAGHARPFLPALSDNGHSHGL